MGAETETTAPLAAQRIRTESAHPSAQTAVIDWNKGTNLLRYSENFVTGFSISNAVVSQANITAPDGSNLVRKLVATNANIFHLTSQTTTQSAGIYTQSVYAKAEGRDFLYMNTRADNGSNRYGVKFNIATELMLMMLQAEALQIHLTPYKIWVMDGLDVVFLFSTQVET